MYKNSIAVCMFVLIMTSNLSGCDIINSVRMSQINSDATPVMTSEGRIKLKSVFKEEKPYIYANVDGEELLFLLDTGASYFVLQDTPKVRKLKLSRGFDLSMGGWGEQERSKAFQTDIKRISLGGVHFDNMKAAYLPISKTHYYLREDEATKDGIIGHDIMKHFTWEFDAANNEIYISQAKYQPESNAQRLELSEFFNKISVKGDLAVTESHIADGEFIIDTGSRHYVKISSTYAERHDVEITSTHVRAADFGLSGKVEHDRVTLPSLSFGDITLNKVKVNLIPGDDDDDMWIIGNALMNQFKTVIDYKDEAFYLVPKQPFVTDYNLLGLELRKIRSGEFVVRFIFPSLPGSELDIEVGDIVTSIDNMPASSISLSRYNDISSTLGQHKICIERQNKCFNVLAEHIDGYSNL